MLPQPVRSVRALVLAACAALATMTAAQVTPAFLPGDDLVAPAAGNQTTPALCAGGSQVLAVWADSRSSPISTGQQSGRDIWAARLDASGALIDVTPFPVNLDGGDQRSPRVAWNGTDWLVAWVGPISTTYYWADALFAARVAADGTVLDPEPLVVRPDLASGTFGDVASDGAGWSVFFTGWAGVASWVYGARIAADGTLLDATPKGIAGTGGSPYTPYGVSAAWAGDRYLVAWSQWSAGLDNVRGQLVDADLVPQGAAFNVASSAEYEVDADVASNGSQFYVAWERYNVSSKVHGTRVTTAGAVLDGAAGVVIYTGAYAFQGTDPGVAWDGTQWVASWTEPATGGLRVNAGRISAAGVVLDLDGVEVDPLPVRQEASAVAGLPGGGSLVAWQDSRVNVGQPNDIYAAHLDTRGVSLPLGSLADSAPAQVQADAASGPDGGALLAWISMNSGLTRVMAQSVSRLGSPAGLPVELASGTQLGRARIAFNGSVGLVTWGGPGGVFARRIGGDALPLDAAPFPVMSGTAGDVAAQGDTFLVTALVPETNPQYVLVRSRRVSGATGAVLDPASVAVGGSFATDQSIASFDGGFLLAWTFQPTHDNPISSIGLRLVSVLNVPGAQAFVGSQSIYNTQPRLADGGDSALVVWKSGPGYGLTEDVVGRLVGPGLALPGSTFEVNADVQAQQVPAVGWDGTQYVVAWQDTRAAAPDYLFDLRTDVYAARVTEAGALLDPDGIALATDFAPEAWPCVAGLGTGSALVGWSDLQPQAPFAAYRLAFTLLGGVSAWVDLGYGIGGQGGVPDLVGAGTLAAGTPVDLALAQAAPLAPASLVIGLTQLLAPFKGGVLVPSPDLLLAGLLTDASGGLLLAGTWPAGVPSGLDLFFQAWVTDAGAPAGLSASNAVCATVP